LQKRADTVKLTKRNPIFNVLTYKLDQFDPESAQNVKQQHKEVEKTPLIPEDVPPIPRRSATAVAVENNTDDRCCSCTIL